jgi:hypothetical protein
MSVGQKNTTGKPDTSMYNLGRGRVYIAALNSSGLPEEYRDVGNVPGFSLGIEEEELLHQSSREGLKKTDARVTISKDVTFSLTMDELSSQNLALFFAGTTSQTANPAVAGITEYEAINAWSGEGTWFQIKDSSGTPARDIASANVTVVSDKAATNVTLVLNTDYEVDEKNGRIFLIPGSSAVVSSTIHVTLAADAGAQATVDVMAALAASSQQYALTFIGVNPTDNDEEMHIELHKIRFSAEGDFALSGDDWTQMQVNGTAEENTAWPGASKTLTITK